MRVDLSAISHGNATTLSIEGDDLVVVNQFEEIEGEDLCVGVFFDKASGTVMRKNTVCLSREQVSIMYSLLACEQADVPNVVAECVELGARFE